MNLGKGASKGESGFVGTCRGLGHGRSRARSAAARPLSEGWIGGRAARRGRILRAASSGRELGPRRPGRSNPAVTDRVSMDGWTFEHMFGQALLLQSNVCSNVARMFDRTYLR